MSDTALNKTLEYALNERRQELQKEYNERNYKNEHIAKLEMQCKMLEGTTRNMIIAEILLFGIIGWIVLKKL